MQSSQWVNKSARSIGRRVLGHAADSMSVIYINNGSDSISLRLATLNIGQENTIQITIHGYFLNSAISVFFPESNENLSISLDNVNFTNSLQLPIFPDGSTPLTTVYIRFRPRVANETINTTIRISSTDAETKFVYITGTIGTEPTPPPVSSTPRQSPSTTNTTPGHTIPGTSLIPGGGSTPGSSTSGGSNGNEFVPDPTLPFVPTNPIPPIVPPPIDSSIIPNSRIISSSVSSDFFTFTQDSDSLWETSVIFVRISSPWTNSITLSFTTSDVDIFRVGLTPDPNVALPVHSLTLVSNPPFNEVDTPVYIFYKRTPDTRTATGTLTFSSIGLDDVFVSITGKTAPRPSEPYIRTSLNSLSFKLKIEEESTIEQFRVFYGGFKGTISIDISSFSNDPNIQISEQRDVPTSYSNVGPVIQADGSDSSKTFFVKTKGRRTIPQGQPSIVSTGDIRIFSPIRVIQVGWIVETESIPSIFRFNWTGGIESVTSIGGVSVENRIVLVNKRKSTSIGNQINYLSFSCRNVMGDVIIRLYVDRDGRFSTSEPALPHGASSSDIVAIQGVEKINNEYYEIKIPVNPNDNRHYTIPLIYIPSQGSNLFSNKIRVTANSTNQFGVPLNQHEINNIVITEIDVSAENVNFSNQQVTQSQPKPFLDRPIIIRSAYPSLLLQSAQLEQYPNNIQVGFIAGRTYLLSEIVTQSTFSSGIPPLTGNIRRVIPYRFTRELNLPLNQAINLGIVRNDFSFLHSDHGVCSVSIIAEAPNNQPVQETLQITGEEFSPIYASNADATMVANIVHTNFSVNENLHPLRVKIDIEVVNSTTIQDPGGRKDVPPVNELGIVPSLPTKSVAPFDFKWKIQNNDFIGVISEYVELTTPRISNNSIPITLSMKSPGPLSVNIILTVNSERTGLTQIKSYPISFLSNVGDIEIFTSNGFPYNDAVKPFGKDLPMDPDRINYEFISTVIAASVVGRPREFYIIDAFGFYDPYNVNDVEIRDLEELLGLLEYEGQAQSTFTPTMERITQNLPVRLGMGLKKTYSIFPRFLIVDEAMYILFKQAMKYQANNLLLRNGQIDHRTTQKYNRLLEFLEGPVRMRIRQFFHKFIMDKGRPEEKQRSIFERCPHAWLDTISRITVKLQGVMYPIPKLKHDPGDEDVLKRNIEWQDKMLENFRRQNPEPTPNDLTNFILELSRLFPERYILNQSGPLNGFFKSTYYDYWDLAKKNEIPELEWYAKYSGTRPEYYPIPDPHERGGYDGASSSTLYPITAFEEDFIRWVFGYDYYQITITNPPSYFKVFNPSQATLTITSVAFADGSVPRAFILEYCPNPNTQQFIKVPIGEPLQIPPYDTLTNPFKNEWMFKVYLENGLRLVRAQLNEDGSSTFSRGEAVYINLLSKSGLSEKTMRIKIKVREIQAPLQLPTPSHLEWNI